MKKLALSCIFALIGAIIFSGNLYAQSLSRTSVEVKSKEVSKTRGTTNPNIKSRVPLSDDKPMADPSTSETKCLANFENATGLFVEIYIDGNYKGTVGAWGKMSISIPNDYKTVYCLSVGKTKEWNIVGQCADNADYILK